MPSEQHEAIVQMLVSQPRPETPPSVQETRTGFEAMAGLFGTPEGLRSESIDAGGVPGEWIDMPASRADRLVLYLHGGGYVIGSLATHRGMAGRIAQASGARGLAIDYRLAPEHPFPAALDDALAAYRFALSSGFAPERIAIAGDSAGGGLTLATLLALRDAGDPLPAAGVCMSPWADLEGNSGSARDPQTDDPMIRLEGLQEMGRHYLAGEDPKHPHAAPVYASYGGLPPLFVLVGTRELLHDDSLRVAEKARAAGVDLSLEVGEGLIHVWPFFGDQVPEAVESVARIGDFVRKHTG
jgi:monoterpene epsilon-lactone hydrolase